MLRGIPSVIYGNLTSGIVKITNKSGYTRWKSRFKADGYSKLFALSKGFEDKDNGLKINTGINYLDAKPIPETGWKVIKESPLIWQLQKSIHRTKPQPVANQYKLHRLSGWIENGS